MLLLQVTVNKCSGQNTRDRRYIRVFHLDAPIKNKETENLQFDALNIECKVGHVFTIL